MKSKLLLIFVGGTIGMIPNPETGALEPAESAVELMKQIPELEEIAELEVLVLDNIDSSNMSPLHWTRIAQAIEKNYDAYEGFIIAQGTDTMAYAASALSFALQGLAKPVVFTGSLIPLQKAGSDARNNLVYACMTAALDMAEVCIVLSNMILRGNRAKKHHESFVAAFHSPNYPILGELGRPIVLHEWCKKREKNLRLRVVPEFDANIAVLRLFPGFRANLLEKMLEADVHGIVVEGFGPGNVPFLSDSVIPMIERCGEKNIPVVIANQMEHGKTNLRAYDAGLRALEAGALSSSDMTIEATITKTMWALAQTDGSIEKMKDIMEKNIAGELS